MLKVEHVETLGWEAAFRGMRNPKNSWDKSDSEWEWVEDESPINPNDPGMMFVIGENDLKLAEILANAGQVHGKFLRMIVVTMDITAPLYWWKEFDTYKVGTVANSCSTMHKIHTKPIELSDFSIDDFELYKGISLTDMFINVVDDCEKLRQMYLTYSEKSEMSDCFSKAEIAHFKRVAKSAWKGLIQLLPTSYNQKRTVMLNYAVCKNIYEYRHNHKLDEWHVLCDAIAKLPHAKELIIGGTTK